MIKKKIKSSRLKMKEVVVSLFVVLLLGISISLGSSLVINVFAENDKEELKPNKIETEELKKSPYTLDEIYDFISSGTYFKVSYFTENCREWYDYNNVIINFYDYFTKDTKFMIYDKRMRYIFGEYENVDPSDIHTIMIDYDEYMKITKGKGDAATGIYLTEVSQYPLAKYREHEVNNAAHDVLGACNEINRCANPEENVDYEKEENV